MESQNTIEKVRKALGRSAPLASAPVPPAISEPVVRLVHTDFGLPELFAERAKANKMHVLPCSPDELVGRIGAYLKEKKCRSLVLPDSPFLEKLGVYTGLAAAGFDVKRWSGMTLDELYDVDASVTDVYAAVAETGSLVVRGSSGHGRSLSLVPNVHVAIVEPRNIVPDLVDFFEKLGREPERGTTVVITGPSKTADIEMNLVVGVHGPGEVGVFILQ